MDEPAAYRPRGIGTCARSLISIESPTARNLRPGRMVMASKIELRQGRYSVLEQRRRRLPSPAMLVAIVALVAALTGSAVALQERTR